MSGRKIFGIIVIIVGAVLMFFSNYIAGEVAAGRLQIAEGQRKVDRTESVFSTNQYTKPVGKSLTRSGQRRIDEGSAKATRYESLSNQLKIWGIILIIIGAGLLFFWKRT